MKHIGVYLVKEAQNFYSTRDQPCDFELVNARKG